MKRIICIVTMMALLVCISTAGFAQIDVKKETNEAVEDGFKKFKGVLKKKNKKNDEESKDEKPDEQNQDETENKDVVQAEQKEDEK